MVQRILMLALVLLAFTMPTEAITLQELQTSPQFKLVHTRSMNGSMESGGLYIYLNTVFLLRPFAMYRHSILCAGPTML